MSARLLSQPLQLKHHTLRNRVIMGSMHTGFEEHPDGAKPLAALYAERAKGGVALIITGGIAPNADGVVAEGGAKLSDAGEVAWHRVLADAVHRHGAKICMQILHTGRYAMTRRPVSPSPLASPINPVTPHALSTEEVRQTVADYIRCAQLAQQAGYDGVEIHSAHGYLLDQFYSPVTNKRTDDYTGQTLAGRTRLHVEIIQAIRRQVGSDFVLSLRLGGSDYMDGGAVVGDVSEAAKIFETAGIDMLSLSGGMSVFFRPGHTEAGYFAELSAAAKKGTTLPVLLTGGIADGAEAEAFLEKGQADLIGIGRAALRDHQIYQKILSM